jgi:hypothetical protein
LTSPAQEQTDRRLSALGLIAIGVYFFRLVRPALRAGFSPDDCMNLYRAWYFPLRALVKANLAFFLPSDFIRPMGAVWYRAIYFLAGFHPLPFHAVDLALLGANILLVYCIARRLADSRLAALAAALLFAYQERWAPLYFDTGYIFDVLCGFFYFAALLLYVSERQSGRGLRPLDYAVLGALFVCGLNSKEMAVTLPAAIVLYELLFERRRRFGTAIVMGVAAIAFAVGRTGQLAANAAYRPEFTLARFMETSAHFQDETFAVYHWFTPLGVAVFAAALLALAIAARSKPMLYAWAFTAFSMLPIAFVPPRGGPQYYIPLAGCALYAGGFLGWVARRIPGVARMSYTARRAAASALLAAIAWPIYANGKHVALGDVTSITEESPVIMGIAAQLRQSHPTLPVGARVLFLRDPVAPNLQDLLFIVRLVYRDRTIDVERVSRTHITPSPRQMQTYDVVFDYDAGGLREIPQPPLALAPRILRFFDAEWKPITAAHPAKRGSRVIAFATDLGPTRPEVAPGEPFPREPLAEALVRLAVTVDGTPARVVAELGSPGEVNVYRFDFIMPRSAKAETAKVRITAAGAVSPVAEIPVTD